jgi:hypothetical protein
VQEDDMKVLRKATPPLRLLSSVCAVGFAAGAGAVSFTQISTTFNSPIGIDHHAPTNSVVISVNYSTGQPLNFERVQADGTHVSFSTVAGFTDEVKIATARPGNPAGFASGTLFTGNGVDGEIAQISPDGTVVLNPWVSLPGAGNGLMRGSLYVDRTGVYGGDLIVATTGGEVWRVTAAGVPTMLNDVNVHLEGLSTVPNNAAQYGPLAGKIIAGAEGAGLLYAFDATGAFTTFNVGVAIEDIDLIVPNENFFGVNFGTGRILGAGASQWTSMVGDILLTSEFGGGASGLWRLRWDGMALVANELPMDPGSANRGQWEHVTFSPAGIVEIPPVPPNGIPEPGTLTLLAAGLLAGAWRRRGHP